MWCHLPTGIKRRGVLYYAVLASMIVALITTLIFAPATKAAPSTDRTISFQGRLLSKAGAVVSDGYYNIQFKIYEGGSGTAAVDPNRNLQWTESYVNNGTSSGVQVKNGYFSVSLGSNNPFDDDVDWDSNKLWLSMNIAGRDAACSSFGTGACIGDGEMLPMKHITATPYSINSGAVGGKTADELVQLGQGVQADISNNSSIYINKTGSGNLMQLQNNGDDVFAVGNTGDLVLGGGSNKSITLSQSTVNTEGSQLTIEAGMGGTGDGSGGGDLVLRGGSAGGTDANGGDLVLSGGAGTGTGTPGLVILDTPTFSTVTNDANCYTSGALVANSCTISSQTVNSSSAVIAGFSTTGKTATLPDPTNTTPGRIIYVMAATNTENFSLRINVGEGDGIEQSISMRKNTTATMIWNGSNWTAAGANSSTSLQDAYDNSQSSGSGGAELTLKNTPHTDGLTIRDNSSDPVDGPLLEVQSNTAATLFSINSSANNLSVNAGAETAGASASTFQVNTWGITELSTVERYTADRDYIASGEASVKVETSGATSGAFNQLNGTLAPETTYSASVSVKLDDSSSADNDFFISYSADGTNLSAPCIASATLSSTEWQRITCTFQTPASGISSSNHLVFGLTSGTERTFYLDNASVVATDSTAPNVKIGGSNGGQATLFTLDKSASAPGASSAEALLGSMYYDTTLGKVQCYEADGWGACSAAPDTFVTLSPEYSGAVVRNNGTGTMTTDFCSDTLDINNGTSSQADICGDDETYNFYQWTSSSDEEQTRSIFITYQLPSNFKEFVAGTTSLMGRTTHADSSVSYQLYRSNENGLTPCDASTPVSTGAKTSWQKATASGNADPANCHFEAGDKLVIHIDLSAQDDHHAYVSDLSFTLRNQ